MYVPTYVEYSTPSHIRPSFTLSLGLFEHKLVKHHIIFKSLVRRRIQFSRQTARGCRVERYGRVYTVNLCGFFCGFKQEKRKLSTIDNKGAILESLLEGVWLHRKVWSWEINAFRY